MKQSRTPSRRTSLRLSALFALVLSLAGCSNTTVHLDGAGSPMNAQASMTMKDANHYLPVHDMPPDRTEPLMSPAEHARISSELIAARERQAPAALARKRGR